MRQSHLLQNIRFDGCAARKTNDVGIVQSLLHVFCVSRLACRTPSVRLMGLPSFLPTSVQVVYDVALCGQIKMTKRSGINAYQIL